MEKYIVGIGAANVDVYGKSLIEIKEHYDHPSIIKTAAGGVTRNVLENASKLGISCKLLTALGDDVYGDFVVAHSQKQGIGMSNVLRVKGARTGLFMQVQDKNNDMHMALCDMDVLKNIDIAYIKKNQKLIKNASAVIIDPSLDKKVLDYIFENIKTPIFVDPISDVYAKKIKPYLKQIYCIKPNKTELGVLANIQVDDENVEEVYQKCLKKGVSKLVVSLGRKGCIYQDENGFLSHGYLPPIKKMVNASGAGDAFMAVLLYGYLNNIKMDETIAMALMAGKLTISDEHVIHPKMSVKLLRQALKKELQNEL